MAEHDPYLTLLCGLPGFDALFARKIPPLSRLRLDQRLQLLTEDHRRQLTLVEQVLDWSSWPAGAESSKAFSRIQTLLSQIDDSRVKQLTLEILDLYAVHSALHLRTARTSEGEAAVPAEPWCVSRFRSRLEQHWSDDDLGLGHYFLWLGEASEAMKKNSPLTTEKVFIKSIWSHLQRQQPEDEFGFFAVVIYVLKWMIADRWSRTDSAKARHRFQQLLASARQKHNDSGQPTPEELSA